MARFRDECLSLEWSRNRREANVVIAGVGTTMHPTAFQLRLPDADRVQHLEFINHGAGSN
jgi:hypothetical protein